MIFISITKLINEIVGEYVHTRLINLNTNAELTNQKGLRSVMHKCCFQSSHHVIRCYYNKRSKKIATSSGLRITRIFKTV